MSRLALNPNSDIFLKLKNNPIWWENLKNTAEVYIDIRQNAVNAYYKGGSIIKLKYDKTFSGEIASEYIPTERIPLPGTGNRTPYQFENDNIEFSNKDIQIATINQFSPTWMKKIKQRINRFNEPKSEKAIQGDYVVNNSYFIDSEIQFQDIRIDLVWLAVNEKKIYFVELKTIEDRRLYYEAEETASQDKIVFQLKKYSDFIAKHKEDLIKYYSNLISIKHALGILPKGYAGPIDNLADYEVQPKPILLIGDCTRKWIADNNKPILNKVKSHAYAVVYHGRGKYTFEAPNKDRKNVHYIC